MALDILPIQVSSIPCERLFSASKLVASDRCSRLGSDRFKELLTMKSVWRDSLVDRAAVNTEDMEEIELTQYIELLDDDAQAQVWDDEGWLD